MIAVTLHRVGAGLRFLVASRGRKNRHMHGIPHNAQPSDAVSLSHRNNRVGDLPHPPGMLRARLRRLLVVVPRVILRSITLRCAEGFRM
jgi:hypothetical protein